MILLGEHLSNVDGTVFSPYFNSNIHLVLYAYSPSEV